MSQHDLSIANQGFPAFRSDLNDALQALGSMQSGATAPSTTYANMVWYDTANNVIKVRNEDNDAWITMVGFDQTTDILNKIGIFSFPTTDGSANQVLTTNGSGTLSFTTLAQDKISEGNSSVEVIDTGNGYIVFTIDGSEVARIDNSGNLGIGVTPSAWSVGKAFEARNAGNALFTNGAGEMILTANAYYNAGWKYGTTGVQAAKYICGNTNGTHIWETASSGTAGNAITFTQAMTLNASGNLGITGSSFDINPASGNPNITMRSGNTFRGYIEASSDGLSFGTGAAATIRLTIPSDSAGIKFPATQVASSDANTLDDYEEGTFSPTFAFTIAGNSSFSYSVQEGKYTKIGRQVTILGYLSCTVTKGTGSGDLKIASLPFANPASGFDYPAGACYSSGFPSAQPTGILGVNNAAEIYISKSTSTSTINSSDLGTSNTLGIRFGYTYFV